MNNKLEVTINNTPVQVKEYQNQRVVTLKEIDQVHQRPDGTARRNFNTNKEHFIDGVDFFKVSANEFRTQFDITYSRQAVEDVTLLTESGYLMLVKSFTDDLAWKVQRQLVNTYFKATQSSTDLSALSPELRLLINMEIKQKEQDKAIDATNARIDSISEIVALNPNSWRSDARNLIVRTAHNIGGNEFIRDIQSEIFKLVDERAAVSLETRLTNKRRRMADEGVCKSRRDKLTKVDVIAEDKKLIEIYIAIVKEMAVRHDACKAI